MALIGRTGRPVAMRMAPKKIDCVMETISYGEIVHRLYNSVGTTVPHCDMSNVLQQKVKLQHALPTVTYSDGVKDKS